MRGQVKYVKRFVWYKESTADHWRSDVHPYREIEIDAILYNGDEVKIDKDNIRNFYGCNNITSNVIYRLSGDLHNVWIEYSDGCLDGELADYI